MCTQQAWNCSLQKELLTGWLLAGIWDLGTWPILPTIKDGSLCSGLCNHSDLWESLLFGKECVTNPSMKTLSTESPLGSTRQEHCTFDYIFHCWKKEHVDFQGYPPKKERMLLDTIQVSFLCEYPFMIRLSCEYNYMLSPLVKTSGPLNVPFNSVTQLCPTLCNPMNHGTPGLPVHHQLLQFTQTHVHRVGDAIQPSHPLLFPSPAPNPSQHQSLFQWVNSLHQVVKVLEFQLQHQSFQWTPRTDLL